MAGEVQQRPFAIRSISQLNQDSLHKLLSSYSILDALDVDDRPSFVVDVSRALPQHVPLDLVHCNPALTAKAALLGRIKNSHNPSIMFADIYTGFRNWIFKIGSVPETSDSTYLFDDYIWASFSIGDARIVSGVARPTSRLERGGSLSQKNAQNSLDARDHKQPQNLPEFARYPAVPETTTTRAVKIPDEANLGLFDCTLPTPPPDMSDHLKYFRNIDWESTPLGPMARWSSQLRCLVNVIMKNNHPAVLFWGDDVVMIYNEHYTEVIGLLHPCMGQSARVAASNYWDLFQPLVDHVNATGAALSEHDIPLFLDRHGFLEETFFSFQFVPTLNDSGHITGYYQPLLETTKHNILERRVSSLVDIGSQTAKARNLNAYWEVVRNTLALNDKDIPFALLYSVQQETETPTSPGSVSELRNCVLKGTIGVEGGHPIAPQSINLLEDDSVFGPYFLKAAKSRSSMALHFDELGLPDGILANIDWKGYGDPCRSVIICPILPTTGEQVMAFLILGINPRRPFDADYQQFIHVLGRLLATSLASVVLFDEEMRQKEKAIGQAAQIQSELIAEIKTREKRFQRFADRAEVAIFIMDAAGAYVYRNQRWYDIFEVAAGDHDVKAAWHNISFPEDIEYCESLFAKLVVEKTSIEFELKTTMRWTPPATDMPHSTDQPEEEYRWILCSAFPELDASGQLIQVFGTVTDISRQKWREVVQRRRKDIAVQSKHHLEHFIDTTSHEMRNPLSAIMQCADEILSLRAPTYDLSSSRAAGSLLDQIMESAQTVAQCAQHMKRIVDDILTISKIDSGLLVITPIDAQPESVAHHAVKMFESEAKAAGVAMSFDVDKSYRDLRVDWVSVDPTRLLQVLINLITNAIKFTRLEDTREIKVTLAASLTEPQSNHEGVQFTDRKIVTADQNLCNDWKKGSPIYLQFCVSDTGRGLTEEEMRTLFARFSQASPRTHITYGGTGLGLFISRRLTELQGGAIGLASKVKKGSTFAFYIKARRTSPTRTRRSSFPHVFPEDMKHRYQVTKESDSSKPLRPTINRLNSAVHSDIPAEALGHMPDPPIEQLQSTKSIPDILHVLVVEDNLVNQRVLAKQLRNLGCVVSVANHGLEALEHLKKTRHWNVTKVDQAMVSTAVDEPYRPSHQPVSAQSSAPSPDSAMPLELSIILLDWEMPVMNGLTCVSKIRELEHYGTLRAHIPVIGVTANVREQQISEAIEKGMDDVVGKPFRVQDLLVRMRNIIDGMRTGEDLASIKEVHG